MKMGICSYINSAYINLLIGLIGIVFAFLVPILSGCSSCNLDAYENSMLSDTLETVQIRISGTAMFAASCPLALDLIMDLFNIKQFSLPKSIPRWISRAVITVVSLMFGLQIALGYDYFNIYHHIYAVSFLFGLWSFRIVLMTSFLFVLCISKPKIFTVRQTAFLSTLTVVVTSLRFYGATALSESYRNVSISVAYIYLISLGLFIIYWSYKLCKARRFGILNIDDYYGYFYFFLLIITIIAMWSSTFYVWFTTPTYFSLLNSRIVHISVQIYIHTACIVIMSIVPGRIARIEVELTKDHIIESKQAYVRYVSHELRTPLNTVFMGIKLSIDQISIHSSDPIEKERRLTLIEVSLACEVALEILNDLLLYDKLQNGLLTLTKEKIFIFDFVTNCINMFRVQLRSKKLKLTLFGSNVLVDINSVVEEENVVKRSSGMVLTSRSHNSSSDTKNKMYFRNITNGVSNGNDDDKSTTAVTHELTKDGMSDYIATNISQSHSSPHNNNKINTNDSLNISNSNDNLDNSNILSPVDTVEADKVKLGQVLRNLLSNAIKFTPVHGEIEVSVDFILFNNNNSNKSRNNNHSFRRYASKLYESSISNNTSISRSDSINNKIGRDVDDRDNSSSTIGNKERHNWTLVNADSPRRSRFDIGSTNNITSTVHDHQSLYVKRDNDDCDDCSKGYNNDQFSSYQPPQSLLQHRYTAQQPHSLSDQKQFEPPKPEVNKAHLKVGAGQQNAENTNHLRETPVMIQQGMLVVEVKDSGVGINIEDQERLFKEIIQFRPEVLQCGGGSGLGLFITKGIVDLHGGKISVHSEGEGKGTTFRVEIPMSQSIKTNNRNNNSTNSSNVHPPASLVSPAVSSSVARTARSSATNITLPSTIINAANTSTATPTDIASTSRNSFFPRNSSKNTIATATKPSLLLPSSSSSSFAGILVPKLPLLSLSSKSPLVEPQQTVLQRQVIGTWNFQNDNNSGKDSINERQHRTENTAVVIGEERENHNKDDDIGDEKGSDDGYYSNVVNNDGNSNISISSSNHHRYEIASPREIKNSTQSGAITSAAGSTDFDGDIIRNRSVAETLHNGSFDNNEDAVTTNHSIAFPPSLTFSSTITSVNSQQPQSLSSIEVPRIKDKKIGLKLLIVDDSSLNRKMLRRLLEAQGHVCEEAADGFIAVNMMKEKLVMHSEIIFEVKDAHNNIGTMIENINDDVNVNKSRSSNNRKAIINSTSKDSGTTLNESSSVINYYYDAILMDFVMPVMNGPTATTEIRKLGYKGTIMGVTGNALEKDKNIFMAAGASHVFIKPLDVSLITKALQGCGLL